MARAVHGDPAKDLKFGQDLKNADKALATLQNWLDNYRDMDNLDRRSIKNLAKFTRKVGRFNADALYSVQHFSQTRLEQANSKSGVNKHASKQRKQYWIKNVS